MPCYPIVPYPLYDGQVDVTTPLVPPTVGAFTARYPAFAQVDSALITAVLAEASNEVTSAWSSADQPTGMMLYAAHLLSSEGYGGDSVSVGGVSTATLGPLKQIREGDTSLTYDQVTRPRLSLTSDSSDLSFTTYGRRFLALGRRNSLGVLVV